MWLNIDSPRVKICHTCTFYHFLTACSRCASVFGDFSVFSANTDLYSIPLSDSSFLTSPVIKWQYLSFPQDMFTKQKYPRLIQQEYSIITPAQGSETTLLTTCLLIFSHTLKSDVSVCYASRSASTALCICKCVFVVPSGLWNIQRRCSWGTTVEADPLIHQMVSRETDQNQKRELEIRRVSHVLAPEETF